MDKHAETVTPCQATAPQLVEDLGSVLDKARDIASRIEFIAGGLAVDDPNPRGAALALVDAEMAALDLVALLERMGQSVQELTGTPYMLSDAIAFVEGVRHER